MATNSKRALNGETDGHANGSMAFLDHLEELRTRIIRSLVAIGLGMLVAIFFVDRIGDFILAPTIRTLPRGEALIYTKPGEGFSFYFDVVFIGGLILSAPFVAYQLWRFIAPGLYTSEKKFVIPFVILATIGTLGGALFTHYLMFPGMMMFFGTFNSRTMRFMPRVEDTFGLYRNMMVGMIVVFQVPTVVFFLAKMRVVTAGFLLRHTHHAILASFVLGAFLTSSPDPWNQTLFAAPLIALYLISIGIAWAVGARRKERPEPASQLRLVIGAMVIDQARKHFSAADREVRKQFNG